MSVFPSFLRTVDNSIQPDAASSEKSYPSDEHVMSRDIDGNVVSVFGDPVWDYSAYNKVAKYYIDAFIEQIASGQLFDQYRDEFKIILFRFIYNGRAGSLNTISGVVCTMKRLFRVAAEMGLSFKDALNEAYMMDAFVYDANLNKRQIGNRIADTKNLYSNLHKLSQSLDDFEFFPSANVWRYLNALIKEYPVLTQQTPVIPTRILSYRICQCFWYIEKFMEVSDQFSELYELRETLEKEVAARGKSPSQINEEASPKFAKEVRENKKYKVIKEVFDVKDFESLQSLVAKVRLPMFELIHAFSGMRRGESTSVAMDGFKFKTVGRDQIPIIRSYTTKMAADHGYFAEWVTAPELEIVFRAGRVLNNAIMSRNYDLSLNEIDESSVPLFLVCVPGKTSAKTGAGGLFRYPVCKPMFHRSRPHPLDLDPELIVGKNDMGEIFAIDQGADHESLKSKAGIEIGKPFPFQSHMYRRSLAVYTARSGLVSLPTLKKQLKHISIQTSAYYGNDAAFAKNFIVPKTDDQAWDSAIVSQRGFIKEFQDELAEGQVDQLYDQVVSADEVTFGGMGTQIQKQKVSGKLPTVLTDREKTLKQVKQGRLRYAETPLGGCMAVEVCDRIAFSSITTCVGCGSSVFNSKTVPLLEKTKEEYESRLEHFGTKTPYGLQLERDIRDIESALNMREKLIETVDITDGQK